MELKSTFLLATILGMVSCQWFDPTVMEDEPRERPHIFVNAVMSEDSTFCSISSVSSGGVNMSAEQVQACVTLEGASEALGSTCGSGASEAMGFWLATSGLTMEEPGQSLSLQVTSDRWDDMQGTSHVPAPPNWSTLQLRSRAIQEGDKVFDELELNLTRDEGEGKWHLLRCQCALQLLPAEQLRLDLVQRLLLAIRRERLGALAVASAEACSVSEAA